MRVIRHCWDSYAYERKSHPNYKVKLSSHKQKSQKLVPAFMISHVRLYKIMLGEVNSITDQVVNSLVFFSLITCVFLRNQVQQTVAAASTEELGVLGQVQTTYNLLFLPLIQSLMEEPSKVTEEGFAGAFLI